MQQNHKYINAFIAIAVPTKIKKTDLPIVPSLDSDINPSTEDSDDISADLSEDQDSEDQDEMIADEPLEAVISENSGKIETIEHKP